MESLESNAPTPVQTTNGTPRTADGSRRARVAVIGGGIAGLACAHYLLAQGATPVVFESAGQLGGLGTHFEHEGVTLDRYYHVILDSDDDLVSLLADLDASDRLVWKNTGMGFLVDGALYPFNTPLDLLRFGALGLVDRIRTGLGALYITKLKRHALDLDEVPAHEWLVGLFGRSVFERIWDPLLNAKFGDRRREVPAYWVWNTLNREKDGGQKVKGYLRGGYRGLAEALSKSILARGGQILLDSPVTSVEVDDAAARLTVKGRVHEFAAVVSTLPMPLLAAAARGPVASQLPASDLHYQGVVNAVVVARKRLERFYWTAVVDPAFEFQGVVETTHVIPPEWLGGRHLYYLMNYCSADTELYARSDELVARQALEGLDALYPGFARSDVENVRVFRAPYVEPVWTLGYLHKRPPVRVGTSRMFLCTTAQAYPRVTAWNTSVALARETATAVAAELATHPRTQPGV